MWTNIALDVWGDCKKLGLRFFMPIATENPHTGVPETSLMDAREVNFGELQFHHFIGACRN